MAGFRDARPTWHGDFSIATDLDVPAITPALLSRDLHSPVPSGDDSPGADQFRAAVAAWNADEYERAALLCEQAIRSGLAGVAEGAAHSILGQASLKRGDVASAAQHFFAALQVPQATVNSVYLASRYLGVILGELGRMSEAEMLAELAERAEARLGYFLIEEAKAEVRWLVRAHLRGSRGRDWDPLPPMAGDRSVRVFVCSTFQDLQAERDQLAKAVFPRLRRICEERGVAWTDVDLRWGIPDEERAEGRVVPICLEEIRKSGFFLAVLGERYGWVPEDTGPDNADVLRSVCEIEIRHAVLQDPRPHRRAFFYFRDPAHAASLPEGERTRHIEGPTEDEVARWGEERARDRSEDRRRRLAALKDEIRAGGFHLREGFRSPTELGEWVLGDLQRAIDETFPADAEPSKLPSESAPHLRFARRLAEHFVGREEQLEQLDEYVADGGPPLIVTGDAGSGKSSLLAAWAMRFAAAGGAGKLLPHFAAASRVVGDRTAFLRLLIQEFAIRFDLSEPLPERKADAEKFFSWWLSLVNGRGGLVLVLDDLHELAGPEAEPLHWLPAEIPPDLRLIVSASGDLADELVRRGWRLMTLAPLPGEQRAELVASYLSRYGKKAGPDLLARIIAAPQAGSPLFLRAVLDELRVFGFADRVAETADRYLAAERLPDLFTRILGRWENDYGHERPRLVTDTLLLLALSRRGLSEPELLDLLGENDDTPLARGVWAPFFLALEPFLAQSAGLLSLGRGEFRRAVEARYLARSGAREAGRRRLARYFARQPVGSRRVEEQPWHEHLLDDRTALLATVTDRRLLEQAGRDGRLQDWVLYWGSLARLADPVAAYQAVIDEVEAPGTSAADRARASAVVAQLLYALGRFDAALQARTRAVESVTSEWGGGAGHGDELAEAAEMAERGRACLSAGRLAEAQELSRDALGIRERRLGPHDPLVASSVNDLAEAYRRAGNVERAIPLHERALRDRERAFGPAHREVAESLINLGIALYERGDTGAAEEHLRRALQILRQAFGEDHPLVADGYDNLGVVLTHLRRAEEASACHRAALAIRERLLGPEHPSLGESLGSLGNALLALHRPAEAAACHTRALRIAEAVYPSDGAELVHPLAYLSSSYFTLGRYLEALELLRRALRIAESRLGPEHAQTRILRHELADAERT